MNVLVKVIERVCLIGDVLNGMAKRFKAHLLYINDKNLRGADLRKANLRGADLSDVDLSKADLSNASLSWAFLSHSDIREAKLTNANLGEADLKWADLRWANLSNANLSGADLRWAKIFRADLRNANLRRADLDGADLRWADLSGADLTGANLSGADLSYADLSGAKLDGTNITNANLKSTKNVPDGLPMACPCEGSFIAWKKVDSRYLIKLEIPEDAKRCSATSEKCRCDKAKVLEIIDLKTGEKIGKVVNTNYAPCTYTVGEMVYPDWFDENRWNECSHGIHFFVDRDDALQYA